MNFYWLWFKRVLFSFKTLFQLSTLFSLFGLILAVASLTVATLAIQGFSSGLEKVLVDKQGHLRLQTKPVSKKQILEDIEAYKDLISNQALFLSFEGLILKDKKFKGVLFEAIEDEKIKKFSFLKNYISTGNLNFSEPFLFVGFSLAKELNLKIGSDVLVIVSKSESSYFSRKLFQFKVADLVDFGRHEFNSRLVLMPLSSSQLLGRNQVSGVNLWLKNQDQTEILKQRLKQTLNDSYFISSWKDIDQNFFEIIESDKKIIFFVLFILIIVAGFNISSSLFVQVFRKTKEISILKAMGITGNTIKKLFLFNGLVLGIIGIGLGGLLGLSVCYILVFIQNKWHFIPSNIYQINEIVWNWKSLDLLFVFLASLFVVVLSSVLPARKAYKMDIKAGLSHN